MMNTSSAAPVLPPRPLALDLALRAKRRRSALGASVLTLALALLALVGSLYFGNEAMQARQAWSAGTEGELRTFSGEVKTTTKLGIPLAHEYDLEVTFADAQGQEHTGPREFSYLFVTPVPEGEDPGVRYDPADPTRFVLSWEAQGFKPWSFALAALVFGLGFLGAQVHGARKAKAKRQLEDLCAQEGEEVLLEQRAVKQEQGGYQVKVLLPGGAEHEEKMPREPLVVERDGKAYVVALQVKSAPGQYLLVESSYAPFVAPAAEPQAASLAATGS